MRNLTDIKYEIKVFQQHRRELSELSSQALGTVNEDNT